MLSVVFQKLFNNLLLFKVCLFNLFRVHGDFMAVCVKAGKIVLQIFKTNV